MLLTEKSLELLGQMKILGEQLSSSDLESIKEIFKKILLSGNSYKIEDIENWLQSNTNISQNNVDKILNTAHYQKAKYDSMNPLKMAPDSCGCGGDC